MGKCSQYIILEKAVSKAVLWQSTSTCQLHWAMSAQTFFKTLLWVCCEGFSEWIMHESVDWVQQMALPNMSDPIQYTAGLNRTVGDCLWEEAPARLPELGHQSCPALRLQLKHWKASCFQFYVLLFLFPRTVFPRLDCTLETPGELFNPPKPRSHLIPITSECPGIGAWHQ